MNSLEMMRSIFDAGKAGMVLIGMPGIEKRIARFPQFYSLEEKEITELLNQGWVPVGVTLPNEVLAPDVIASLIRMSGGNFRLLTRLLTQIERILKVNQLDRISKEIVAAARDSLVIGHL
jgi:DNA transposition AAA+ family ATPase